MGGTDELGRFSFNGITPTTHALKLDRTTLPPRAFPIAVDHRDQGTPGLRFVDLTRGELVHAEFVVSGDTSALRDVQERRSAAAVRDEATRVLARAVRIARAARAARRRAFAARIGHRHRRAPIGRGQRVTRAGRRDSAHESRARDAVIALEQLLPTLDPELGFVGIADLDTVASAQIAVRVKGRLGTDLALRRQRRACARIAYWPSRHRGRGGTGSVGVRRRHA